MGISTTPIPCFLVEWYPYRLAEEVIARAAATLDACAESMSAEGSSVALLTMLAVPNDDVLFGVFTASSAALVKETCDRAGMPAQRLSTATDFQGGPAPLPTSCDPKSRSPS